MGEYVLFQMWGPFRESLIRGHEFYVDQARRRLLSQFGDIEAEADKAEKEWLEKHEQYFDPERHDEADFYEAAFDQSIEFYQLLSDMRDQTRLSVVAGMYHEWDKQLRDWLVREIMHWHRGRTAVSKVWSADFSQLVDLLESLGSPIRNSPYLETLDQCRLVVNVYKHGAGRSLEELEQKHPQYLDNPLRGEFASLAATLPPDYTHLKVTDEQVQAFSDAIVAFWRDVPENVIASQIAAVPDWFEKAVEADRKASPTE